MDLTKEEINQIQRMHGLVDSRDFYLLLDVSQGSTLDEIKKSYYATSRKWHPDRFFRRETGEYEDLLESIFIGINQAFKTLTSIEERTLFDKQYVSSKSREVEQRTNTPSFARHRRKRNRTRKDASERKKHTGKKEKILNRMKSEVDANRRKAETFFELGKKTTFI
jgi:curved DNA-binding protein CbpA